MSLSRVVYSGGHTIRGPRVAECCKVRTSYNDGHDGSTTQNLYWQIRTTSMVLKRVYRVSHLLGNAYFCSISATFQNACHVNN